MSYIYILNRTNILIIIALINIYIERDQKLLIGNCLMVCPYILSAPCLPLPATEATSWFQPVRSLCPFKAWPPYQHLCGPWRPSPNEDWPKKGSKVKATNKV